MKIKKTIYICLLSLFISQALAQYTLKKHSTTSGSEQLSGGIYQLQGSISQVDASVVMSQGDYSLTGGFWQQNLNLIYKNEFE